MTDVLRIVHMLPALTKGGAERVAVDLANASARAGHRVTLVVGWKVDELVLRVRLHPDIRVIYMTETPVGKLQRYRAGFGWLQANRAWLAAQDVLHLHLTHAAVLGTILYALRALSRAKIPAVTETYHSVGMKARIARVPFSFGTVGGAMQLAMVAASLTPTLQRRLGSRCNGIIIAQSRHANRRAAYDVLGVPE